VSAGIVLTGAELEALAGLPWPAQTLYVLGIRPRMDYRTRRVGDNPRVSWQALTECLYVEPQAGVHAKRYSTSKWQAMRVAQHLVRAGLIELHSSEVHRILVFKLLLARGDSLVQKQAAIGTHHQAAIGTHHPSERVPIGENEVIAFGKSAQAATPLPPQAATHPLSAFLRSKHQTTTTSITPISASGSGGSGPGGTSELIFPAQLTSAEKSAIREMLERARANGTSQVLLDELAAAIAKGTVRNRTAYARALIDSYSKGTFFPEKAQQVAERREAHGRAAELRHQAHQAAAPDAASVAAGQRVLDNIRKRRP
jgi:hypothetical protein